jgi:hypothetical protein
MAARDETNSIATNGENGLPVTIDVYTTKKARF